MTTLIYDKHLQRAYLGDTLLDAISLIATVAITSDDMGWKVDVCVRGYVPLVPFRYTHAFTREEALRDATAGLAVRVPRDCPRYSFFRQL